MRRYVDETGLFADFNFKLVVIDALLDKAPSFEEELEAMKKTYCDDYEWYTNAGPIEEMCQYLAELKLEQRDLLKITELCFDGGNELYFYLQPDWDGEEDYFDIRSIAGYENLPNLNSVIYISMAEESLLEPMREQGIRIT